MADEATDTTVQGGDPSPAGEVTPPAIQDEPEAKAAEQDTSVDGDPTPGADGEDGSDAGDNKDPNARWQRRVDKLTARSKAAEEENARLKEEIEGFKSEREKRELEGLQNLPVLPEALTSEERAQVKTMRPQLEEAERDARFWWSKSEDGYETKDGKSYSAEQCREFARYKEREAARLEARLDGIMEQGRGRLGRLVKKYGSELLGEAPTTGGQTPAPPRPPAPQKASKPKQAPERAPGGGAAPSAKDGAGSPPPGTGTQEQLEAAFAFL